MVITKPTIDDFSDTTVMRVIRKIVNYICKDLVGGINNNDIVSGQFSVQGNQLSGTLTKGDGTTIDIPAATLPSGGGSDNPYPTAVSMTLSGTTLNFNMTMSSGTPITGSVDLSAFLTKSEASNTYLSKTDAQASYQPKGDYLTAIPIAGESIGGVKNGGNVTIETDGTMNVTNANNYTIYTGAISNLKDSNFQSKYDVLLEIYASGFMNCYKATVKNASPNVSVEEITNRGYSMTYTTQCCFKGKMFDGSIKVSVPRSGTIQILANDEKVYYSINKISYSSSNTVLLYYNENIVLDITRRTTEGTLNKNEYRIWVK